QLFVFFFSSRRRHTRFSRDWSSDVCSSDLSRCPDLPAYLDHLSDRLGRVSLVVCLDSGGNDYERLWLTTSLRGLAQVHVTVRVQIGRASCRERVRVWVCGLWGE